MKEGDRRVMRDAEGCDWVRTSRFANSSASVIDWTSIEFKPTATRKSQGNRSLTCNKAARLRRPPRMGLDPGQLWK